MAGLTKIKAGALHDDCVTADTFADNSITGDHLSHSTALPDGVTATTQSSGDNSTKVATTAYADAAGGDSDKITEGNTTVEVIDTGSNGHITFDTEGVEKMRIDTAGRVGVGVTPSDFGTNARAVEIHSASSVNSFLSLTNSTTGSSGVSHGFNIIASGNEARLFNRENADMTFWTNSAEGMRLDNSGNLGIGTSDPKEMLQVGNGAASKHGRLLISADAGLRQYIQFTNGGGSQTHYPAGIWYQPSQNMELRAASGATTSNAGQLVLSANGRIGIGTTSPPYDLSLHTSGTTELDIHSSQDNGHSYIYMRGAGTTPAQIIYFGDAANQWAGNITYTHTDDTLKLQATEDIKLKPNNGNSGLDVLADGPVKLYHNNSIKAETVTRGLTTHGEYRVGAPGTSEKVIASAHNLTTIHLSNSGDDANDGSSTSNAVRSITRAWALIPKVCFPGQSIIFSFGADYEFENGYTKVLTGWAHGDYYYGPHVRFVGSGAQRTITMNANVRFRNCTGIRFENLKFAMSGNTGQYIHFLDCKLCKFYNNCAIESSSTAGWSNLLSFTNCTSMKVEMNMTLSSSGSAGLGGVMVIDNSEVYYYGTLSKTGTKWGNTGISIINGSYFNGTYTVNNFTTGLYWGMNHYNAETGARGLINSCTISNCTTGITLRNFSYPRKYNVTYSGNTTNETILTNGGAFT